METQTRESQRLKMVKTRTNMRLGTVEVITFDDDNLGDAGRHMVTVDSPNMAINLHMTTEELIGLRNAIDERLPETREMDPHWVRSVVRDLVKYIPDDQPTLRKWTDQLIGAWTLAIKPIDESYELGHKDGWIIGYEACEKGEPKEDEDDE